MEVNSFRELVAEVIGRYNNFKAEATKAEQVLNSASAEIIKIKEEVLKANSTLGEVKANADIVKEGAKDLAKTRGVVENALKQLESLKKEYQGISKALQSFNDLVQNLSQFDLENIIKEVMKVDSQNVLLFAKVVDEIVLTDKYQELITALSARFESVLKEVDKLKLEVQSAKRAVNTLLNYTKTETKNAVEQMRTEALRLYYQMQEITADETERAKVAIDGYVSDFYKVITELQSKVLTLKVLVMDSLNNALRDYNARIEAYTQEHINKLEQEGAKVEQKFQNLEAGIVAMEKLNSAIVTGKKYKFRYNVFTALQYINTARITLTQNDGMLVSTLRFYHESFAKEVLDYLVKEREFFNEAMQQKEAEAQDVLKTITAIRADIELKRRNLLFLSLMKG